MKAFFDLKLIIPTVMVIVIGVALGSFISSRWLFVPDNIKRGDFRNYFADEQTEVIMLGTLWCPICAKTRKFLTEKNIKYLEYDIEASEEGKALAITLGQTDIVPIIILRDRIIRGFNPDDLQKLLHVASMNPHSSNAVQIVSQHNYP